MKLKDLLRQRKLRAWCLYDVGNSAFATTVMAVLFPIFFRERLALALDSGTTALAWGLASALALLLSAFLGPLAGTWADMRGNHRKALLWTALSGSCLTALLGFLAPGRWLTGLVCFVGGSLAFAVGNVFYDAFLPALAPPRQQGYLSSAGFAAGYLGGGILLLTDILLVFLLPPKWGYGLAFLSVGLWWAGFTLPLYLNSPDMTKIRPSTWAQPGFRKRLTGIASTPGILRFLFAYWLYNDGIGTVMKMGVLYGSLLGIGKEHLLGALLLTQFVGIPCTLLFGRLGQSWGDKKVLLAGLTGYLFLVSWAFFLQENWQFWVLALGIGTVQGGTQALSRSLYSKLVPPGKSGEYFGFYQLSGRLAGLAGPLLFGGAARLTGSVRSGIPFLGFFFIAGMVILVGVDPGPVNRSNREG